MTRERLDSWLEKGMAALLVAVLVFAPLAIGGVRARDFVLIEWAVAAMALLWVLRLWVQPGQPVLWLPASWAVMAFLALAGVRYATAEVEYVAREEVLRFLVYGVLFLAVSTNLPRQKHEKLIVTVLLALAVGLAVHAVYQYISLSQNIWSYVRPPEYTRRGSGTFINPNHLAGFLEMVAPLGIAFCLLGRLKPVWRILAGYAAVMALAGIGVSLSRGGWIATAGALVLLFVLLILHRVHRAVSLAALSVLVVAGGVFIVQNEANRARFAGMFQDGRLDNVRFLLWEPGLKIWQENFWFGSGPAHYDIHFRKHRPPQVQMRASRAHNDYINALADWGVAGTALGLLPLVLVGVGLGRGWRAIAQQQNTLGDVRSNRLALALGAVTGLTAILAHAVTDFNFHIPANAMVAVTLLALLAGQMRHVSESHFKWPAVPARLALTVWLLAASGVLLWAGAKRWNEEQLLTKADRLRDLPFEMCETLEKAYDLEPNNPATAYKLGEAYRMQSWAGAGNYIELAERAMRWHARAMELQPYDPYPVVGTGMCLDWLERHEEAEQWFRRALELDPNNFFVLAHMGWHFVQVGDYHAARPWLERSLGFRPWDNNVAADYLALVRRRLEEEQRNRP